MITLTEFLLARIAEDEAAALAIHDIDDCPAADQVYRGTCHCGWPARVLAECDAKRRIIALHPQAVSMMTTIHGLVPQTWCDGCDRPADVPCQELRILVSVYADHPDYRQEWRP